MNIVDETAIGKVVSEQELAFETEEVMLRDVIERRVQVEVRRFNERPAARFNGLVQPTGTEVELNGYRFRKQRTIDVDAQVAAAHAAFEANGFFVLVNDQQADSLDDVLRSDARVVFVKLVPLVGG